MDAHKILASELKIKPEQVKAAMALLRAGAGVPFIARYRREKTGSLEERKLYAIQDRLRVEDEVSPHLLSFQAPCLLVLGRRATWPRRERPRRRAPAPGRQNLPRLQVHHSTGRRP